MRTKKKSNAGHDDLSGEAAGHEFGISIEELETLMQRRGDESIQELNETYGGLSGLEQKLKTNLINGLSGDKNDLSRRINAFGRSETPSKPRKTFLRLMFDTLQNIRLIRILIFATILLALSFYPPSEVTFEAGAKPNEANIEWIEGIAIIIVLLVVILVSTFDDWTKEREFRDSQSKIEVDQKYNVIRESIIQEIAIKDIVVGDICQIKSGDLLPVDGIIIQSYDLKVDESSLTGESDLIKKHQSGDPFLLSGTHIKEGNGKMLVLAVGQHSQVGMIYKLLHEVKKEIHDKKTQNTNADADVNKHQVKSGSTEDTSVNKQDATKLQEVIPDNDNQANNEDDSDRLEFEERSSLPEKLTKLVNPITNAAMKIVILMVLILLVLFVIEEFVQRNEWSNKFLRRVVRYVITGIIVYVVSIPEGILLSVTISLAYTVKKMMKDNNLVRHLDALESIGNVTTICFNKTGTLTTNLQTVVQICVGEKHWKNVENSTKAKEIVIPANTKEILIEGLSVNSSYSSNLLFSREKEMLLKQIGNKTECGLLGFVAALDGNYDDIRRNYPEDKFLHAYKFNSERKSMSTVIQRPDSTVRIYTKGASDIVLKKCKTILNRNGEIIPFSSVDYDRLVQTVIEPMGFDGLRTICLAYRDFSSSRLPDWNDETSVVDELTCICICGIGDPLRAEASDVIDKCRNAGITAIMITGDNVNIARLSALKCGIISDNDNALVIEGTEFNRRIKSKADGKVEQNLFDKVWPHLRVLARSSPQDKYVLVDGIMASKINPTRQVVAVIGEGTNDGPALKKADVGFVMDMQGTDVAKEASDIILVDDSLNSVVKAVMWGRNLYNSIGNCLQFQLTVNVVVVLCTFIGICIIKDFLLRDIQMLWIYLTMNILPSLSLAIQVPTEELLRHKPRGRTQPLISRTMMKNIIGHAIYQLTVILFILLAGPKVFNIDDGRPVDSIFKPSKHFTMIFNVFILMNLFNEINSRKIHGEKNIFRGISKNPLFYGIWIVTFVLQILIIQYGSFLFSCVALTFEEWMWCLLFGLVILLWNQMLNFIPLTDHMSKSDARDLYKPASPPHETVVDAFNQPPLSNQSLLTTMSEEPTWNPLNSTGIELE